MDDTEPPSAADASATAAVVVRSPGRTPIHLLVREPIVIGRECDGLLLDDPLLSRRHLEVGVDDGVVVVTDLGSTNGTAVDGRQVSEAEHIACGHIVTFGSSSLQVLDSSPLARPTRKRR